MLRVLACLVTEHDPRLVLLAAVVCTAASFASFHAYSHVIRERGSRRTAWAVLTAICTAAGIWATHFAAMLAYQPAGYSIGYNAVLTIASLLIAAVAASAGFAIASRGGRPLVAAGGAIVGIGIGLMQLTGMEALIVPGTMVWDRGLVLAALAIGVVLGSASLLAWYQLDRRWARWVAPVLLTLAILGLHFTAIAAVTIVPDPDIAVPLLSIGSSTLAIALSATAGLVLLALLATTLVTDQALTKVAERKGDLDVALAHMSQGLAMFDAGERLVLANDRYAEIYGLEPRHLKPGTTLRELIEYRIARGLYPGMTAEDVLASTRERLARGHANHLTSKPGDGRTITVSIHPRTDGGWVVTLQDITERERLNARLREQNALLQQREEELAAQNKLFDTAIGNMSQGMCLYDARHRIVFANGRFAELYKLAPEQVQPGTSVQQIFEARAAERGYRDTEREDYVRHAIERFKGWTTEIIQLSDGRFISVIRRRMPDGGLLSTHEDITEREQLTAQLARQNELLKEREQELNARNEQLDVAMNNMLQGLAMFDAEFRLVMCNKRYAEMYRLSPEQVRPGTPLRDIIAHRIANGEFLGTTADELVRERIERVAGQRAAQYVNKLADGRHIAVSTQPMPDGGTVTTHDDITEQRRSEARIAHMALHDTLTGLPNRVLLNERLDDALRRSKRGEIVAMHLLDLDHFKTVNDTLGHPAGDTLLESVAGRLRSVVRDTDTIARMGGDEFAIVQTGIAQPAEATALAHRVIEAVGAPYVVEGHQVVIGTSVGIAVCPSDGTSHDQLIRNADLALYRAKGDGRRTYRFFEQEMDAQMQARRLVENDLRKALAAGEFELHFQPYVNLERDAISGLEALVRWRHPAEGLILPGTFVPLAEEMGLIVPLGEWAVREACAAAVHWPGELKVAVNLSPAQFKSAGLVQVVMNALAATGLAAERLELEITETTLMLDGEATLNMLYQLRALGVRIALDDFGTGYSSLSLLQSFPFDKLKIDRSFVRDIAEGVGSLNIVRAVTAMAAGLGMTTTAEGVETQEQLDTVRAEGCTEMQGFVFSPPMPADAVVPFLRQRYEVGHAGEPANAA